jgi:hypothetical protein
MLAIAAVGAAATMPALAVQGPYYDINEERLEQGEALEAKDESQSSLKIEGKSGQVITCTGAHALSGALLDGSSGLTGSTSKERSEYTGCKVSGNGSGCNVEGEKITTATTKVALGYSNSSREGPALEILEPLTGKTFAEAKFTGTCTVSSTKLLGAVVGEAVEPELESTAKAIRFTKTAKTLWLEASDKLTSAKSSLEAFGGAATEEVTDDVDTKSGVSIQWLEMSAVCNTALTEFLTQCNRAHYFPANEEFKGKALGALTLTGGGNTISCTGSEATLKLDENGGAGATATLSITGMTFAGCENAGEACELTTPVAGLPQPPWSGVLIWTRAMQVGRNGFLSSRKVNFNAECGMLGECAYESAGLSSSIGAPIYNADDTNKPAPSEQAELQYQKAPMRAIGMGMGCSGPAELSVIYSLTPEAAGTKFYLAAQ